jgi:hypothetical protein
MTEARDDRRLRRVSDHLEQHAGRFEARHPATVIRRESRHAPAASRRTPSSPSAAPGPRLVPPSRSCVRNPDRVADRSTARPIGHLRRFHSPGSPRMLMTISSGNLVRQSSDVSAFSELPRPLDWSITVGRAPPTYSPAAMPNASSSRVASVV